MDREKELKLSSVPSFLRKFILLLLWGCLVYSQFIYFYVIYDKTKEVIAFDSENLELGFVFVLTSILVGVISFKLPKRMLKNVKVKTYQEALKKAFFPFIVKWLFAQSIVIYGLVFSFKNEHNYLLPFMICSLIIFLISFPSQNNIKRMTGLIAS